MPKKSPVAKTLHEQQNDRAERTILGLDRPQPFNALSDKQKISVLRDTIMNLRNQFYALRTRVDKQNNLFKQHQHHDSKIVLPVDYADRHDYESNMTGASEFDPLR